MPMRGVVVVMLALGITVAAGAQDTGVCTVGVQNYYGTPVVVSGPGVAFSATVKMTFDQKLADGNAVHGVMRSQQARNAVGAMRIELPQGCWLGENGQPAAAMRVQIDGWVGKPRVYWVEDEAQPKVAYEYASQEATSTPPPSPAEEQQQKVWATRHMPKNTSRVEDLGIKMIAGVAATGRRIVWTTPAGAAGNLLPIEVVEEAWESKELQLTLMSVSDDPRRGRTVSVVEELSLAEPDPALFTAPPGYRLVEENVAVQGAKTP